MHEHYGVVLAFGILGFILMYVAFILQKLVGPKNSSELKLDTYECGEPTEGSSWVQFNIRFYVIALIFIIFDVEVVFLFPWAVVFKDMGFVTFIEVFVFLAILLVGLAYVWVKGDLEWVKMKLKYGTGRYAATRLHESES
ncbi:MAG: NADH-quinone oxidoreductase subunit A [Candidatus Marinimicrobia bacterium]|nr:NADH-quinone oxidoreductase subunit A [Candidatus Neomarinimicrobiota bacterium]